MTTQEKIDILEKNINVDSLIHDRTIIGNFLNNNISQLRNDYFNVFLEIDFPDYVVRERRKYITYLKKISRLEKIKILKNAIK